MRGQTQFCLLIYNPMNTIVKSIIEYSYWSYVHQLSYRKGEPHYLYILFHSIHSVYIGLCCQIQIPKNEPPIRLQACEPYNRSPNTCSIYDCHSDRVHDNARHILHMLHTVCLLVDKVTRPNPMPGNILLSRSVSCGDAPGMGGYLPAITSSCDTAGAHQSRPSKERGPPNHIGTSKTGDFSEAKYWHVAFSTATSRFLESGFSVPLEPCTRLQYLNSGISQQFLGFPPFKGAKTSQKTYLKISFKNWSRYITIWISI